MSTATEKAPDAPENTANGKTTFADVALVSELNELGWKVEGSGKNWMAFEKEGKDGEEPRKLGPATSVKALATQVKLAVGNLGDQKPEPKGNGKVHKVESKKDSQPILAGPEEAVFADLTNAGQEYRKTTMEVLRLQELQKDQKDTVMKLMHKFKDELQSDPETGGKCFTVNVNGQNVVIALATEEKEVLKTRVA